jgi:site-specific DNA-adenine methylase
MSRLMCSITRSFCDPDYAPKKMSRRSKRAAAKQQRERERIRALEDAMDLQKELRREEEIRLMEMEMDVKDRWEDREKERETIRQVEVETETESEGRLSEGVQSEQSMERLLNYA